MKYYALADETRLHSTPDGASLLVGSASSLNDPNLFTVNKTASTILRLCDGTRTTGDLVQELASMFSTEPSCIEQDVSEFLADALASELVKECEQPTHQVIQETGDPDYYFPLHVMVELTKDCNLECVHCYRGSGPTKFPRMETGKLLEILIQLKRIGVRIVELTGGEPLMHPDFLDIVDFVGREFENFAVVSNGVLWTQRHVDQVARYKDHVTVQIDLDGPNAEIHQKVRVTSRSFERAVETIKRLKAASLRVRAAMNVLPDTLQYVEETLQLAKSLGVDWFAFAQVQQLGRANGLNLQYTEEQGKYLQNLAKRLPSEFPEFVSRHSESTLKALADIGNCGAGYRSVVLSPTGKVRPCVMFPEEVMVMGDLAQQSVHEVFRQEQMNFMHDLRSPGSDCDQKCPHLNECRGCYARSISVQTRNDSSCSWAISTEFAEFFILGATIFMFRLNILLASIACAFVPLQFVVGWHIGRFRARVVSRYQNALAETNQFIQIYFGSNENKVITDPSHSFDRLALDLQQAMVARSILGQLVAVLTGVVSSWGPAAIYAIGAWMVMHDRVSLGTVIAITQYLSQIYGPTASMTGFMAIFRGTLIAFGRIYTFLDGETGVIDDVHSSSGRSQ